MIIIRNHVEAAHHVNRVALATDGHHDHVLRECAHVQEQLERFEALSNLHQVAILDAFGAPAAPTVMLGGRTFRLEGPVVNGFVSIRPTGPSGRLNGRISAVGTYLCGVSGGSSQPSEYGCDQVEAACLARMIGAIERDAS